jgi:hypothetical protein
MQSTGRAILTAAEHRAPRSTVARRHLDAAPS